MKQLLLITTFLALMAGAAIAQPTVASVSPARNAIDISTSSNIVITFSEDMDALGLIQPNAVTVEGSLGGKYTTQKTVSGFNDVLTLDPDGTFIPGEIITVFISALLNDANNGSIDRFSYQFRVETNGTGVGYFSNSSTFTGSIGDGGANMTYMADVDGDGDMDAVVLTRTASDLKFYVMRKNNGADSYTLWQTFDMVDGVNPQAATFNDIDGDGDLDFIIFINPGSNRRSFYVYTNNSIGTFSSSSASFHSNLPTNSIGGGVFADVDRDDVDELFIMADNVYGLWPFENNGGGTNNSFTEGSSVGSYGSIAGRYAVSRDFNNDDYLDFAIIKKVGFDQSPTNDSLGVLLSNGSGGFTSHTHNVGAADASFDAPWGMDAGDFDGDGYLDLAIVTNDSLFVLDNNQDGTFAAQRSFSRNFSSGNLRAADMDSDGDLDLITLGSYTSISYNDGSGNFGTPFGFSRGYGSGIVPALADADGDGDLDMIYSVNGTMTVMRNGTVSAPTSTAYPSTFSNNYGNQVQMSWTGGNGNGTLVISKQGSAVDAVPVDGTIYTANSEFGSGSEISTGNFVVYAGNSSNVTITGLTPDSTYHFKVVEYNQVGSAIAYRTSVGTGSVTTNLYPTNSSTVSIDRDLGTQLDISWSGGDGSKQLVAIREGSSITWTPNDSTTYAADSSFTSSVDLGDGTKVISNGTSGSVTVTDLSLSTTYYVKVFDYNGEAGFETYLTDQTGSANITTQSFEGLAFDSTAGYAYQFDGGNVLDSYAELYTNGDVLIDNAFTTELWIKPDTTGVQQYFLSWYEEQLVLGINSSNQLFGFHTQQGTGGSQVTVTGTTTITKGEWYHVALTGESGGNLTLYVNGVEEASSAITDVSGDDNYDDYWYLGSEYAEVNPFYGTVDEVRIWSAVRTVSEIRSFMHRPYIGLITDLGGYWQFNEGTGDSQDGLNNYDASLSNETGWVRSTAPLGGRSMNQVSGVQSGTLNLGNVTIDLTDNFDSAVDVYAFELGSESGIFADEAFYPAGYSSLFGGSRFIIKVFGTPGTFSANLTLTYGSGVIPDGYDTTSDSLTLYTRSTNSDGSWTEVGGASSVSSGAGTATWNGITSFSQFAAVDTGNVATPSVTFTKANFADWTQEANQDRIAYNVWITRKDDQGIFNIITETAFNSSTSPEGTFWAFGNTSNIGSLSFENWRSAIGSNPPGSVGKEMVMYLPEHNEYIDIKFTSWTSNGDGGGFSYIRSAVDIPMPTPITFDSTAGYALDFDGIDDRIYNSNYISAIDDYYSTPDPVTYEMWVNPDTVGGQKMIIASSWGTDYEIGVDSTGKFYSEFRDGPVGDYKRATSTTTAIKNQWYHLATSVQSNGFVRLYVNGVLEDSVSIGTLNTGSDAYYYGGSRYLKDGNDYHYYDGQMDEVRIWQEARSDSAIRAGMYTSNLNADKTEILAYWQMNEGSGTSVNDLANNRDLDLSLDGQPTWVNSSIPVGNAAPAITENFTDGTVTVGKASLDMADGFDNPVDVQVTEVEGDPNQFPTGFSTGMGGKYFVINLFGDPGTFSASLTLDYGAGVVTAAQESDPSLLKLFKRSSSSSGEWTEFGGATTAVAATGVVTWTGITSFSQFIAVSSDPNLDIGITDGADVVSYNDSTYEFASTFFDLTGDFADSALTINSKSTLSGDLFLDQNENGTYDDGADNMLTAGSEFSYTPSGSTKLRYNSAAAGFETAVIKLQLGEAADSVSLDFFTVEGDPEIAGNNGENGWYLLSNPFTTTVGNLLSNIWTQGAINSDAPSGDVTLYRFVQDSAQYLSITTDLDTTKLAAGEGLLAYIFEDDDILDGEDDVDGGWPKTLTNYGNPFGTDVSIPVKNVDHDGVSGTTGSEGFVLLGNPYGWPLSADSLISKLKKVDELANSYVYRWNPTAKVYQLLSSGSIEPYESVFVRLVNSGTSGSLSFNYDDAVLSPSKITTPKLFELELSHDKEGLASISNLRFGKGGQVTIDPYDGYYLGSYATKYANLYTLVGDQPLTINNLPIDESFEKEFPIYLDATVSGIFKLSWAKDLIPDGMDASLVHVETGKAFDLNAGGSFEFNVGKSKLSSGAGTMDPIASTKVIKKAKQNNLQPIFMLVMNSRLGTSNELDLGIPTEVELYQNYPNPFNPASVIRFGVPNASKVKLEVFDVLGRKVMTLLNNETKSPGRYNVQFDARSLSSGMYIYRLVVGDKVMTKKMTLIK